MMIKMLLMSGIAVLSFASYAEQLCGEVPENTPDESFTMNTDGTVLHIPTGLMWMRCAYGQTWSAQEGECTGHAAQLVWSEALTAAQNDTTAGYDDWRVPNIKELGSIVERECVAPSLNLSAFPSSPAENFWTSTTVANEVDRAWSVAFYNGKNNTKSKVVDLHIRFVRFAN